MQELLWQLEEVTDYENETDQEAKYTGNYVEKI